MCRIFNVTPFYDQLIAMYCIQFCKHPLTNGMLKAIFLPLEIRLSFQSTIDTVEMSGVNITEILHIPVLLHEIARVRHSSSQSPNKQICCNQ